MRVNLKARIKKVKDSNLSDILDEITNALNGGLGFGDNLRGRRFSRVQFQNANQNRPLEHRLGYVPSGYLILDQNTFAKFKRGDVPWDSNKVYLQCDTANTLADIFVF